MNIDDKLLEEIKKRFQEIKNQYDIDSIKSGCISGYDADTIGCYDVPKLIKIIEELLNV